MHNLFKYFSQNKQTRNEIENVVLKMFENISRKRRLLGFAVDVVFFKKSITLCCYVLSHCLLLQIIYCISKVLFCKHIHAERLVTFYITNSLNIEFICSSTV